MTSSEIRMGPWRPLYEYLAQRADEAEIGITYDEIEAIVHRAAASPDDGPVEAGVVDGHPP